MNSIMLRNICQEIQIGEKEKPEEVWIKHLRNIIETDIHEQELGCKCDTHIKIGNVHLKSFYETRILFSHSYWIERFSSWLFNTITDMGKKNIIVIGYETDVETVLFSLQQKFSQNSFNMQYGIYEEKKYTQNNGYSRTKENIRYLSRIKDFVKKVDDKDILLAFLCGTSSTLSTFVKMQNEFRDMITKKSKDEDNIPLETIDSILEGTQFISLIQVLPDLKKSNQTVYKEDDFRDLKNNIICRTIKHKEYKSRYLLEVYCTWYDAGEKCPLCFPQVGTDEQPIIETSETSQVPFQMIKRTKIIKEGDKDKDKSDYWDSFFESVKEDPKWHKYIIYDHIDRMDRHYKYYIRTAHLIKDILDDKNQTDLFVKRCNEIKVKLNPKKDAKPNPDQDKKIIDIIVYPSSVGDEVFPLAINKYIFDDNAFMLSINPNKEFRSNFETKYSNIRYVLEQTKDTGLDKENITKIRFHYVTKQLLSIESYSRIKSLVNSLMHDKKGDKRTKNIELFGSVITFVSRMSEESVVDYIEFSKFYSFIDIHIPHLRNYGDSCPICKKRQEVEDYTKVSSLDICATHWWDKYNYYKPKSIEMALKKFEKLSPDILERRFNRFYFENKLWIAISEITNESEKEYVKRIFQAMADAEETKESFVDADEFISCLKAFSGPFLYYKEYEKPAALHIALQVIDKLIKMNPINSKSVKAGRFITLDLCGEQVNIIFNSIYKQYTTLIVLLNCLAGMDSNYILNTDVIIDLCLFVDALSKESGVPLLTFGEKECIDLSCIVFTSSHNKKERKTFKVEAFLSCLVYAFKRIICGISGDAKSAYFDTFYDKLEDKIDSKIPYGDVRRKVKFLFYVLLLENNSHIKEEKKISFEEKNIIEKYRKNIIHELKDILNDRNQNIRLLLAYKDPDFKKLYPLCEGCNTEPEPSESEKEEIVKSECEQEFSDKYDEKYKTCFESIELKKCGFCMNEEGNVYVVSLKNYSVDAQNDKKDDAVEKKSDGSLDEEASMFLVVEYDSKESDFTHIIERLKQLRKLLKNRYYICEDIEKDIANNSIKEAIQAREAEIVMSQGKTVAHNGAEDISNSMLSISNDIKKLYDEKDTCEEKKIYNSICTNISILTSIAIGKSSNEYLLKEYYGKEKVVGWSLRNVGFHFHEFGYYVKSDYTEEKYKYEKYFLTKYLLDLAHNGNSEYFNKVFIDPDSNERQIGNISFSIACDEKGASDDYNISVEETIEKIVDKIEKVNALPVFFEDNNLASSSSMGSIFLVGIIDLLLRNVKKHSKFSDVEISFDYLIPPDNVPYYSIEIRNKMTPKTDKGNGVTNWFFDVLNNRAVNKEKIYFRVDMGPNEDRTYYDANIVVYGSRKEN